MTGRLVLLCFAVFLTVAGCGGDEVTSETIPAALKDQVIDSCVAGGERRLQSCECLVAEMEKSWNEEEFDRYIRAVARAGGDPQSLPPDLRSQLRDINRACG
jgi:hypothetical protein